MKLEDKPISMKMKFDENFFSITICNGDTAKEVGALLRKLSDYCKLIPRGAEFNFEVIQVGEK